MIPCQTALVPWNRSEQERYLNIRRRRYWRVDPNATMESYLFNPDIISLVQVGKSTFREDVYYVLFTHNILVVEGHPIHYLRYFPLVQPSLEVCRCDKFSIHLYTNRLVARWGCIMCKYD